jgi:hypothetical protein
VEVVIPCLVIPIIPFFEGLLPSLSHSWHIGDLVSIKSNHCPMSAAIAELPPVHGQHRNHALAAARRARAVELRTAGLTYDQIAVKLGYANSGTVYHVVSQALRAHTLEAVGELRTLEVERLDSLQLAMWQKAMDGDVPSVMAVVRCIMSRCRLLGLEGPSILRAGDPRPRTLVVPPT